MPVPGPGRYRLVVTPKRGVVPILPPSWTIEVEVPAEAPVILYDGDIYLFVPIPSLGVEGPETGVYCDGAGSARLFFRGVEVAYGTCEPIPPPPP